MTGRSTAHANRQVRLAKPASHWLGARFAIGALAVALGCAGCAGDADSAPGSLPSPPGKNVVLVGFDCSEPLVDALAQGKIQGLVVQNPIAMGETAVKTMVAHLEKKQVEAQISTGETMVTPQNMHEPAIEKLIHPPQLENSGGSSLSGPRSRKWRVMVIPKGTTHEFWKSIHAGAQKAADELGNVEVVWQGPQKEDDRVQQIQLVQSAIAAGVDGVVLAPLDAKSLVEAVGSAIDRGIPVVVFDSALESKRIVSYVATNNYNGGVLAARRLGELLKGKGKVILLRYAVGSESTEQREKGFTDTLAREFPGLELISDSEYAGATSDTAQQKAQSLVTRFRGQVDGVFCPNESSTDGMLRALESAGMIRSTLK